MHECIFYIEEPNSHSDLSVLHKFIELYFNYYIALHGSKNSFFYK